MTRTTEELSAAKSKWTIAWRSPRRLLIAAAIFHLLVTVSVYGVGRYAVFPGTFDRNGIAVSFASDGIKLRDEAARLGDDLRRGQIRNWLAAVSPFHIKLYSIGFAFFSPVFGSTILSAEPVNALCYLAILVLIFQIGREIFNRRAALIAATTVALWPTFLLHTTQLLRDPLFLVGILAFILVILRLLCRSLSWPKALLAGTGGGLLAVFIWLARDNMGALLIAAVLLGTAMQIVRQIREKKFHAASLMGMALLAVVSTDGTGLIPKFRKPHAHRWDLETPGPARSSPGST